MNLQRAIFQIVDWENVICRLMKKSCSMWTSMFWLEEQPVGLFVSSTYLIRAQAQGSEWCVEAHVASHEVKNHLSLKLCADAGGRFSVPSRPVSSRPVPTPHDESASSQWRSPWKRRWRCCVYLPPWGKKLLPLKSIRGTNYLTSCWPPTSPTPPIADSNLYINIMVRVGVPGVQRWQDRPVSSFLALCYVKSVLSCRCGLFFFLTVWAFTICRHASWLSFAHFHSARCCVVFFPCFSHPNFFFSWEQ